MEQKSQLKQLAKHLNEKTMSHFTGDNLIRTFYFVSLQSCDLLVDTSLSSEK